jgi:hypothetical protein
VALATDSRVLYQQLHATAVAIYQAKERINAELAAGDYATAQAETDNLKNLRAIFADLANRFRAAGAREDFIAEYGDAWYSGMLAQLDAYILATGEYLGEVARGLPGAILELPSRLLQQTGWELVKIAVPVVLLGIVAIKLIAEAEKTTTGKRLAGRL